MQPNYKIKVGCLFGSVAIRYLRGVAKIAIGVLPH